jgi:hypothetical protein
MKILSLFLFFWVIFPLLYADPDPDPTAQINADPCGSGSGYGSGSVSETLPKCRLYWCLIEFIDWRYRQSCWYFLPPLKLALLYLLSSSPPPLPCVKYRLQSIQCVTRGEGIGLCVDCRASRWVILVHSVFDQIPTKLLYLPKQKPRRGGALDR